MAPIESNIRRIGCAVAAAALLLCPEVSRADEGGVSFWLPGQYGSLVAVPQNPGWALGTIYYHSSVAGPRRDHGRRLHAPMPRYAPSSNTAEKGTRLKPAGAASPGFATRGRDLVGWAVASVFQS